MVTSAATIEAQNAALIASIKNGAQAQPKSSSSQLNSDFSTFLTLLTTQLQNQDPLNPADTADFTNQLVLYTQAEQQLKTNSQLETLVKLTNATLGSQALGYIGNDVTYSGNTIYNDAKGNTDEVVYSLPSAASKLSVVIKDKDGSVVRSLDYDAGSPELTSGVHSFKWDGLNKNGQAAVKGEYTITLAAKDSESKDLKTSAVIKARVYGLETATDGSTSLILAGNRSIPSTAINSVQSPAADIYQSITQQNS